MRAYVQELKDNKRDNCKDIEFLKLEFSKQEKLIEKIRDAQTSIAIRVGVICGIPSVIAVILSLRALLKP